MLSIHHSPSLLIVTPWQQQGKPRLKHPPFGFGRGFEGTDGCHGELFLKGQKQNPDQQVGKPHQYFISRTPRKWLVAAIHHCLCTTNPTICRPKQRYHGLVAPKSQHLDFGWSPPLNPLLVTKVALSAETPRRGRSSRWIQELLSWRDQGILLACSIPSSISASAWLYCILACFGLGFLHVSTDPASWLGEKCSPIQRSERFTCHKLKGSLL